MRKTIMTLGLSALAFTAVLAAGVAGSSQARAEAAGDGALVRDIGSSPAKAAVQGPTGSFSEEARSTRGAQRALTAPPEARNRYRDLILRHASANGIPFSLADAVIRIESRYNARAHNGGAVGLMQIKPQTARGLGYSGGAAGLTNPDTNLRYGMLYLAQAYRMSKGNTCATVMRYQSGHYATRMNGANRTYCSKARTIMAST